MIRRPPRSTHCISSAASDVYKRQPFPFFIFFQFKVAAADMLAEDDTDPGQLFDFETDDQLVVEAGRLQILAARLARHKANAGFFGQRRLVMAGKTHPLGAAAFEKLEVIGVINDAAGIRILVINADRNGEGVGFRLVFHPGILPCAATMFCNDLFPCQL
eukprot:TRINITY_DN5166_c0_g1_i2.p1 TRINITY_DN5166_c0_g1~~TRINITY_DN5166_c0_g1_i2.p1  ORF type:complete len:160 (+),score=23.28 TRINITY_DN5166_c0_g1_i2:107-586(+)